MKISQVKQYHCEDSGQEACHYRLRYYRFRYIGRIFFGGGGLIALSVAQVT